ncbi:MAG TPA: proton-conducting transporter membrane subunit [Anaerolineae bacterium]|nr:proton-conducting transporter membrane subunit [Anaerolineae bacterium]
MAVAGFATPGRVALYTFGDYQDVWIWVLAVLAARRPELAATMPLFMLSLAGVPRLVDFLGKLNLFTAAVQTGSVWPL